MKEDFREDFLEEAIPQLSVGEKRSLREQRGMGVDGQGVKEVIPSHGDGRSKGKLLRKSKGLVLWLDIILSVQNPSLPALAALGRAERPARAVWACPRLQRDSVAQLDLGLNSQQVQLELLHFLSQEKSSQMNPKQLQVCTCKRKQGPDVERGQMLNFRKSR